MFDSASIMLHSSTVVSRPLTLVTVICTAIVYLVSFAEGVNVLPWASNSVDGHFTDIDKRNWKAELSPFVLGPPEDLDDDRDAVETSLANVSTFSENHAQVSASSRDEDIGIPLPTPIATPLSIVTSFLGAGVGGVSGLLPSNNPLASAVPVSTSGPSGGLLGSVLSIIAGPPNPTALSGGSGGVDEPLGGLLSVLSNAAPASGLPGSITAAPPLAAPTNAAGLVPALGIISGVASVLTAVLGPFDNDSSGSGLLGQLSANVLNSITTIAADPAAVLADPLAAVNNLQSQVSAALDSLPSAVAAGVQIAGQVGGDLADALKSSSDLLDAAPDVADGVADQVGSLLEAAPDLATGIPAAALSAVNQVESILSSAPNAGSDVSGVLNGLKDELSSALTNAAPEISSLAAAVGSQVVGALPTGLQPLVSGAITSIQDGASGLMCQVSDVVSGTTLVFGVSCSGSSPGLGSPSTAIATVPLAISTSPNVVQTQPASSSPQLASLLSSLSSSVFNAESTESLTFTPGTASNAMSALSGLASLISQVTQLSLIATTSVVLPSAPASTSAGSNATPTITVAETTIYYVRTITELIASTEIQTSVISLCPSAFSSYSFLSYPITPPTSLVGSQTPSTTDGSDAGSCPGQGYTCDDCLDGWFCPPVQTPALPAPCGYGWPCYHCRGGWFCVPVPPTAGAATKMYPLPHARFTPPTTSMITNEYQSIGCYRDFQDRVLKDAQFSAVTSGMTNEACINFCQARGLNLAGTEMGSQCYCGNSLLVSTKIDNNECNMNCTGNAANSGTCGGIWALDIWALPHGDQQASPALLSYSARSPGGNGHRKREGPVDRASWQPYASFDEGHNRQASPMNVSQLELAMLSAIAMEVSEVAATEPSSASGIIGSVSTILSMGMSSIASELSLAVALEPSTQPSGRPNISLASSPVVLDKTTSIITMYAVRSQMISSKALWIDSSGTRDGGRPTTAKDKASCGTGVVSAPCGISDMTLPTQPAMSPSPVLTGRRRARMVPRHWVHHV